MKTIGVIGGMSWQSTVSYYQLINQGIAQALGGSYSAKVIINSLEFYEIEQLQLQDKWQEAGLILIRAAQQLERAGVDFILIASNTMHKLFREVSDAVDLPMIHVADSTAEAIKQQDFSRVGLLGTAYTMEQDFYKKRLMDDHQIDVLTPGKEDRKIIHEVIFNELIFGKVNPSSRLSYQKIMTRLLDQGAQGIILGCTEIALLVDPEGSSLSLFDTAAIHAQAAVDAVLADI